MTLVDRLSSTFTEQELQRLIAYRAAVAAGFYNDWDGSPPPTPETEPPLQRDDGGDAEPPATPGATPDLSGR
jgi:hypothetical protein